jgi:hypothetical protein
VLEQYRLFLGHAITGNLGSSIVTGQPALDEVLSSLPSSAALALCGLAVAIVLGVPLGILSAVRQGTWIDTAVMIGALAGISFPAFWLGIATILVFAYWIPLFPALGASGSTSGGRRFTTWRCLRSSSACPSRLHRPPGPLGDAGDSFAGLHPCRASDGGGRAPDHSGPGVAQRADPDPGRHWRVVSPGRSATQS